ncbi:MAG: hypothetical protein HDT32_06670 [Clostridiales bacterium]|nr:hypothetical protein [Clostridiales bacterium]
MKNNKEVNDYTKTEKPRNLTFAHIVFMILFLIFSIGCFKDIPESLEHEKTFKNAHFVVEEATIVKYNEVTYKTYHEFLIYYEFVAPDNKVFTGLYDKVRVEEEAQAMIGNKVNVYYDAELGICSITDEIHATGSAWVFGILGTICILLFFNSLIREAIFLVRWRKYKKAQAELQNK